MATKTKTKAAPKTKAPKAKAAKAAPKTKTSRTSELATLTKAFAGKPAFCEILWFRAPRKLAAKVFDWATIDEGEREDLLSDTFNDGIIEAFMEDGDDGPRFRRFAVPFAYLDAFPSPAPPPDVAPDDWVIQPAGLLLCDTRDGSVHLVHIDGTALVDDVRQVAPTVAQLGLQALGATPPPGAKPAKAKASDYDAAARNAAKLTSDGHHQVALDSLADVMSGLASTPGADDNGPYAEAISDLFMARGTAYHGLDRCELAVDDFRAAMAWAAAAPSATDYALLSLVDRLTYNLERFDDARPVAIAGLAMKAPVKPRYLQFYLHKALGYGALAAGDQAAADLHYRAAFDVDPARRKEVVEDLDEYAATTLPNQPLAKAMQARFKRTKW